MKDYNRIMGNSKASSLPKCLPGMDDNSQRLGLWWSLHILQAAQLTKELPLPTTFHSFYNFGEMPCEYCNFQVFLSCVNFIYFLHLMKLFSPSRRECFNSEKKLQSKSHINQMLQVPTYCNFRLEVGRRVELLELQTPQEICVPAPSTKQVRLLSLRCTAEIFFIITCSFGVFSYMALRDIMFCLNSTLFVSGRPAWILIYAQHISGLAAVVTRGV